MARAISRMDRILAVCDQGLRTVAAVPAANRPSPAESLPEANLSPSERETSVGLMRVNRAGEIAAQALYLGQAVFARDERTAAQLENAAAEEVDHLAWCTTRLEQLGGRGSVFDPAWYLGSVAIGALAGLRGDSTSLGFVAETERQVEAHIEDHLNRLPEDDQRSRAILEQMSADEARHGHEATAAGGTQIREPVRSLMAAGGEVLRRLAYRL